jgi:hypothetical protein
MHGRIRTLDDLGGGGVIVGEDGLSYRFDAAALQAMTTVARVGQMVDFVGIDGDATGIAPRPISIRPEASSGDLRGAHFDIGRVIQRTFSAIAQNWLVFLMMSTLLVGVPTLIQTYGQGTVMGGQSVDLVFVGIGWVLSLIGTYILQGVVVQITVNGLNGKTMTPGAAFTAAASLFLPLLGLVIILGLGTMLGLIILIVPGLILMVLWAVAAPVVVVERRGIFESLQRSRDLTRGHRWPIFGLQVIYFIGAMIVGLLIGGVGRATGGSFLGGSGNLVVDMATAFVTQILAGVVASAGVGALYYELRSIKEGVGPEQMAAIFD